MNNAGHGHYKLLAETSEEEFDALVNVHFKGPYFLTQKLLPLIADGGRILNISSGLTRMTLPGSGTRRHERGDGSADALSGEGAGRAPHSRQHSGTGAIETDFGGGRVRDTKDLNAHIASVTALGRVVCRMTSVMPSARS